MIDDVLSVLKEQEINTIKDGFTTIPKSHSFATWRISHRKAGGADGCNLYWEYSFELYIFYRDGKNTTDEEIERVIESQFREIENLESDYDYNSKDELDITIYRFTRKFDF